MTDDSRNEATNSDEQLKFRYKNKFFHYLNYVTVEPTLVLYMMAFMVTSVIESAFYVYKACTVNHGYNKTVCDNINEKQYADILKEIQKTTANFHLWNNIAGHGVPIVLALFVGAWSDKRGRKLPLLLGLVGKLYFSAMIVVNTIKIDWPVEYVIYTATLPMAFTGADVVIFASAFTYLVDVTSPESRTMRMTVLEVFYLATMPSGVALGSYLFKNVVNKSYTSMFIVNTCLMSSSVIYTFLRLKWRSNPRQQPLGPGENCFLDFFDYNHVIETAKAVCRKRPKNRRCYLALLILMMGLYVFQRDEREMMYMYCQLAFNWTVSQFSTFRTFQSGLQDVVLLFGVKIMSDLMGWRDTLIIMFGAGAHAAARAFYAGADDTYLFYAGGVFAAFGPVAAPVIRSMVSKIVGLNEKGKIFSVLAVADNAVPLVSGIFYSQLYHATINFSPESIFYLTMATQLGVFLFALFITLKTEKHEFEKGDAGDDYELEKTNGDNLNNAAVCYEFENKENDS